MSRGDAVPQTASICWVFLNRYREDGFTIRRQRGEPVAYVLDGKRVGDHTMTGVLAKIPVATAVRTSLAEVRLIGQRWLHQQ